MSPAVNVTASERAGGVRLSAGSAAALTSHPAGDGQTRRDRLGRGIPSIEDTYLQNRYRVQPNHANNYETVHGGNVMKWMDELGAMSAMRHAGEPCVTASIDEMNFHRPVPVGETVVIESFVYESGRTSAKVQLRAARENPRTGDQELTTQSRFVFVAIDENGRPVEVPDLRIESGRDEELRQRALDWDAGGPE